MKTKTLVKKLPNDIKLLIAKHMIFIKLPNVKEAFKIACILSETCKEFKKVVDWDLIWSYLNIDEQIKNHMKDLTPRQQLSLIFDTYCQKCKIPGCKKIYWPIPIRVCYDCVRQVTLNEFELKKQYNLSISNVRYYNNTYTTNIMSNLRHYSVTYGTNKTIKSYLVKDLENILGCKLEESHLNDYKREIADIMEIDPLELSRLSTDYVRLEKPSLKIIERTYYTNLANEKYNALFDKTTEHLKFRLYSPHVINIIETIISKISYEKWLKNEFPKIEKIIKLYKDNVNKIIWE